MQVILLFFCTRLFTLLLFIAFVAIFFKLFYLRYFLIPLTWLFAGASVVNGEILLLHLQAMNFYLLRLQVWPFRPKRKRWEQRLVGG